ncbi:MAG: OmpA family protein [Panacagrimonas sp.]
MKTRIDASSARPKPIPAAASAIFTSPAPPAPQVLPRTEVRFDLNSVTLSKAESDALKVWAASWGPNPAARLRITGYAMDAGASQRLSEARAREVQAALMRAGIPPTQFVRIVHVGSYPAHQVSVQVTNWPEPASVSVEPAPTSHHLTKPEAVGARPMTAANAQRATPSPQFGASP